MLQSTKHESAIAPARHAAPVHRHPGATPAPTEAGTLAFGSRDQFSLSSGAGSVRELQAELGTLGYFKSSHGPTGGYFTVTQAAVRGFQRDNGLPETGRADRATQQAIARASQNAPAAYVPVAAPTPAPWPAAQLTFVPTPDTALQTMGASELASLGRTNPQAFFDALRPAAEECERTYGVPVAVTLGQAAYETGFGTHVPAGTSFNLFGHKGVGPAGTVRKASWEKNHSYLQVSNFKCYNNFAEGVIDHGATFYNGNYPRTVATIQSGNRDPRAFLRSIEGVYHQDGSAYTTAVMGLIRRYNLDS